MSSPLLRAILFGCIGVIVGYSTGVAAFGDAVNGAVVFGPIGFVVGWLLPLGTTPTELPPDNAPQEKVAPSETLQAGDFRSVETSINEMVPVAGRALVSIWNIEMRILIAVGVMEYFVRHPWLLLLLAFLLLAIFMPLGLLFSVTGMAALHYNAKAENQFIVPLSPAA